MACFALEFENCHGFMGVEIIYSNFDIHKVQDYVMSLPTGARIAYHRVCRAHAS